MILKLGVVLCEFLPLTASKVAKYSRHKPS